MLFQHQFPGRASLENRRVSGQSFSGQPRTASSLLLPIDRDFAILASANSLAVRINSKFSWNPHHVFPAVFDWQLVNGEPRAVILSCPILRLHSPVYHGDVCLDLAIIEYGQLQRLV